MNTEPDIKITTSDAFGVASIIIHPDGIPITNLGNFCRLCNREDFMEALNEVPVMSVEQLNKVSKMSFPGM